MEIRRCMQCMYELKPGETVCPKCGTAYGNWRTEPFTLKPGTILDGKYLVGEMLGQGGFGITYIGLDLLLEQKVAIKEYFPMSTGMVSREGSTTVVWSSAMMEKTGVQKGFDSFLKEARKMAKLRGIPSVVGVNSVFIQNETAYIVMDFIEGETLQKKLEREGPMEFDTCVSLLTPIMQALAEVHQHGIIHRDISPDNIMVQKNGKLILLDLGAAKDLDIQGADGNVQSSQMVAKHGFSPFEQYGRNGKIGPWTDVYAMAATMYYCCTGVLPPSAIDRVEEDTLSCQPLLTNVQFDALAACMTILPGKRSQDMVAMLWILEQALGQKKAEQPIIEPVKSETPMPKPKSEKRRPARLKWLMPIAGIAVLCLLVGILAKPDTSGEKTSVKAAPTEVNAQTEPSLEETKKVSRPDTFTYDYCKHILEYHDSGFVAVERVYNREGTLSAVWEYGDNGSYIKLCRPNRSGSLETVFDIQNTSLHTDTDHDRIYKDSGELHTVFEYYDDYYHEGRSQRYSIWTNDSLGRTEKREVYSCCGLLESEAAIEYTADGGYTDESVFYFPDGSVDFVNIGVYDTNGNHILSSFYDSDGTRTQYSVFTYDQSGNLIRRDDYDGDGTLKMYCLWTYDSNGNRSEKWYYADGTPR